MADENPKMRLGRGLAALLGDVGNETTAEARHRSQRRVPIEFLRPNPLNPRQSFPEAELEELAASIRERDIIQPIVVRGVAGTVDAFEIIAGERRWRAAQRAGLHDVPVVIVEADDRQALEFAIIENIQRADLNPMDEARGYENLIAQFGYSQSDLAKVMGKSRSHVANTLRLARLPDRVKEMVVGGDLSAGHARALLAVSDPELIARRIVAQGLTVRDIERIAQREAESPEEAKPPKHKSAERDADTAALEARLSDILGLEVSIDHRGDKGGAVRIRYRTLEQLEALSHRLASIASAPA
ncbi:ParB/RepB/Spo0J family partition protein [Rhabdaerophilum calidifontis]|uniref:ParB/RepB/Spo0J family partition protein n=1 Tax=Rhabdaerophilum calidifontis TaxID=2604328 RepID=UPI00123B4446|nr:ParB/RepB/Spo0J family partition protein [Rhabdaerophilum calidifontis]